MLYRTLGKTDIKCSALACGECEPKCPQNIPITEYMKKAKKRLS